MRKIFIFMTLFSMLFSFQSCTDKDLDDNNHFEVNQPNKKTSYIREDNPYNNLGIGHNQVLYEVGSSIQSQLEYLIESKNITQSMMDEVLKISLDSCSNIVSRISGSQLDDVKYYFNSLIENMPSRDIMNKPTNFDLEIGKLIETSNGNDTVLLSLLYDKEGELINQINYYGETDDLRDELITITIFKYSLIFWRDAADNTENPWHEYIVSAYKNQNLVFIGNGQTKFLDGLYDSAKNFVNSAVAFVSGHIPQIVGAALGIAGADWAAVKITSPALLEMGPIGTGIYFGIIGGSSVVGGICGWAAADYYYGK